MTELQEKINRSTVEMQKAYSDFVNALNKPGEEIIEQTTPINAQLNHMSMLLAGETGELIDAIKKHTIYGKPLDFVNVIEELGDIEFALEALRQLLSIHRDEVIAHNVEKLTTRYPEGHFSNEAAQARADKQISIDLASGPDESVSMEIDQELVDNIPDNGVVDHG